MNFLVGPSEIIAMTTTILLLLLNSHQALLSAMQEDGEEWEDDAIGFGMPLIDMWETSTAESDTMTQAALHCYRLWNTPGLIDGDLGYWVKPRSTTWFSRFLLDQYDDARWVKLSRFTKAAVFSLTELLQPHVQRKNTKYRLAIPPVVRVACALFKLTHGASLLLCSELFVVGRSSVSMVLRDVVHAINNVLRAEISWPRGEQVLRTESEFQQLCGLPGVVGAIDGTHVTISKPKFAPVDYYYFKSEGYSLNCQAVVDSRKRFLDLFLGMPGSTNDSRVLRRSTLYYKASHNTLWDEGVIFNGFTPYLLGDSGYPLLPWLLVPHHSVRHLPVADALFNKKQTRGRCVVENALGILKQSFRELLEKSELHVKFLSDVIVACALLHNMLLKQSHEDVERLLEVLRVEGYSEDAAAEENVDLHGQDMDNVHAVVEQGVQKRRDLEVFLTLQRITPV